MSASTGTPPPALSEAEIAELCGETIFRRAKRYYHNGYVLRPRLDGNTLRAEVRGSAARPYKVSVIVAPDEVTADCDCLYWEEYCKHVGAVLLAWALDPDSFALADGQSGRPAKNAAAFASPIVAAPLADGLPTGDGLREGLPPEIELRRLLDVRTLAELRQIARRREIPLRGTAKNEIVAQLAAGLLEPARLGAAVASLAAPERVLLDLVHLLTRGLFVPAAQVAEAVAALQIRLPGEAETLLRDLRERGLLAAGQRGYYGEDSYRVPAAVLAYLPPADYLVRRVADPALPASPVALPPDELLYLLWRHFRQHEVQRRPAGDRSLAERTSDRLKGWHNVPEEVAQLQARGNWQWLPDVALTALPPPPEIADGDLDVIALLAGGDREAAEFGFHLLRQLKLLAGKDRFTAHDEGMRLFLRRAPGMRQQAIAEAWLDLDDWSELTLVLRHDRSLRMRRRVGAYGAPKPKDLYRQLAEGRRFLVRFLLRLEEGAWYSLPALVEVLRRLAGGTVADPLLWQSPKQAGWWLEQGPEQRLDPRQASDWAAGYGRFFVEALRGPLRWLGVATVAEVGGEEVFRVDGLRALLSGEGAVAEEARPIEVGEDLTVSVPAGGDLGLHDFLLTIAEPGEATPRGLRYRITPGRVSRAFAAGHDAEEMLALLEQAAGGRLPATVRSTLEDWWARYGELHLYTDLTLIEFADDYTLPELLAATSLSQRLVYQFSPRLVAVDPESAESFVEELVRRGYTPKVAEETG